MIFRHLRHLRRSASLPEYAVCLAPLVHFERRVQLVLGVIEQRLRSRSQ